SVGLNSEHLLVLFVGICCCRPREGGDPYSAAQRCGIGSDKLKCQWLWVPAFAGTTETRAMSTQSKPNRAARTGRANKRAVDPVVTEIVRNGVMAVTEEMKTNLMRPAYNIIIYEALDFTTGLFTPEGETISIGIGLPMFIRGMSETVKAKIKHFGRDNIKP